MDSTRADLPRLAGTVPRPETTLPAELLPPGVTEPERVGLGGDRDAAFAVAGAAVGGVSLALAMSFVLGVVAPGWVPLTSFVWFVVIYLVLSRLTERGPAVRDRFWTVILCSAGAAVLGTLALVLGYTLLSGREVIAQAFSWGSGQSLAARLHFLTHDMTGVGPVADLSQGGILHAIVGTLIQISIALAVTVPLGLTTALFLAEVGGRFARFVRTIVEAMTALPSVVAGLFIYAAVVVAITQAFSGFAAALSITVLMLPIMIRSADSVLRLVPGNLREAGLALGASQWSVVWRVVLPTVRSGLTTAIILATAHGIGETAPVLLTAGVTDNLNVNPFHGPMNSLPLAALEFVKGAQATLRARGFATAAVLLALVLVLFLVARRIGGRGDDHVSPRHRARVATASRRTADRVRGAWLRADPDNARPIPHGGER